MDNLMTAAAKRLLGHWYDDYDCTKEGLSRKCLDDIEAVAGNCLAEHENVVADEKWFLKKRFEIDDGWLVTPTNREGVRLAYKLHNSTYRFVISRKIGDHYEAFGIGDSVTTGEVNALLRVFDIDLDFLTELT